jgi:hypothetical protein
LAVPLLAILTAGLGGCGDDGEPAVGWVPNCPRIDFDETVLGPDVEIVPDVESVAVGDEFHGVVLFTNPHDEPITHPHHLSQEVGLFYPGTTDPAAIHVGVYPAVADGLTLDPGDTGSLPLNGGTVACGGATRLEPGVYDMRVALVNRLSDPFPITVTD